MGCDPIIVFGIIKILGSKQACIPKASLLGALEVCVGSRAQAVITWCGLVFCVCARAKPFNSAATVFCIST